jgi:hypothetical protein
MSRCSKPGRSAERQVAVFRERVAIWAFASLVGGCAAGNRVGQSCDTGADCESGACHDGTCVSADGGGGAGAGGSYGGGGSGQGGDAAGGGGGAGACAPNHDGLVERAEVPLAAGLDAKFRIATNVTFSTASALVEGTPTWNLDVPLSGDHASLIESLPLAGTWFEAIFPGATYAARLSDAEELLGVFELTDEALLLRGVVSFEAGLTRTELEYDPAVVVLSFPLELGKSWSTDATVTGYANGVFGVYYESYDSVVDERGDAVTPFATFDALRVSVDLTRTAGVVVTQKTFAFVTECFGTVATVQSQLGETGDEFVDVAEIKRLTP